MNKLQVDREDEKNRFTFRHQVIFFLVAFVCAFVVSILTELDLINKFIGETIIYGFALTMLWSLGYMAIKAMSRVFKYLSHRLKK